jgi:hypothetical protein
MRVLNTNENHNENEASNSDAFHSLADEESDDLYQNDLLD